jgi:hypothetical protein
MYEFNTLIEMNDFGGTVFFYQSIISNFNSCGALVRNKRKILSPPIGTLSTY